MSIFLMIIWRFITATLLVFNAITVICFANRNEGENIEEFMGDFCNPIKIHKSERVNWIGTILQTILSHIVAIIPCFCYWVWKLCTFGMEEN